MNIRERCLQLSDKEKLRICADLLDSLVHKRREKNPADRGQVLLGYMAEIYGMPILINSRKQKFVWARTMVSYQLLEEGFRQAEVARMMGLTHASIIHLKHKMEDVIDLPEAFQDIMDIWKQFQNKIQDDIHE